MKTNKLRLLTLLAGLGLAVPLLAQTAPQDVPKKPEAKQPPKPPIAIPKDSLEEYLARGLRNNSDIAVSRAKLQLAEAELQKTRQEVLSLISKAYYDLQSAKKQLQLSEAELIDITRLVRTAAASKGDLLKAEVKLALAKAAVEASQAALNSLVAERTGGQEFHTLFTDRFGLISRTTEASLDANLFRSGIAPVLPGQTAPLPPATIKSGDVFAPPKQEFPNLSENQKKILQLLSTEVRDLNPGKGERDISTLWEEFPPAIQNQIKLRGHGDALLKVIKSPEGELALGAWLELVEDSMEGKYTFVIREYGLLLMLNDSQIRDALPAVKTWKQFKTAKTSDPKLTEPKK